MLTVLFTDLSSTIYFSGASQLQQKNPVIISIFQTSAELIYILYDRVISLFCSFFLLLILCKANWVLKAFLFLLFFRNEFIINCHTLILLCPGKDIFLFWMAMFSIEKGFLKNRRKDMYEFQKSTCYTLLTLLIFRETAWCSFS